MDAGEDVEKQVEQTSSELSKELMNLQSMYSQMQKELADEQSSKEKELAIAEKGKDTAVKVAIAETKEQYLAKIEKLQQEHSKQLNLLISQKQQY